MNQVTFNIIAMVIAITVTALNFAMAVKFKLLRRGVLLISSGLLIGIMVHSIVEFCESINLISLDFLVVLMPILVSTGSLLILAGGAVVSRDAIQPLDTIMRDMREFSSPESPFHIAPEITKLNNEIGALARNLQGLIENLQRTTVSKIHFESIIATANDAFVSIDENGTIIEWNPAAERAFGWSRQEAMGKPMAQTIIPLQYREAHLKGLSRFIGTGEGPVIGKTLDLSALHRDGREFPAEITIWAVRRDKKYQFNAFIRDITERKKAHEALAEREKALRQSLAELNSAHEKIKTTQNQLVQSEKLASIGQLAAGVAHEINNPVGFISNNMEILRQYVADYIKVLGMGDRVKESLIRDDLPGAKAAAGEMVKMEKEMDLEYIINDSRALLQHNIRGIERIQKIVMDLRTFARDGQDEIEHARIEDVIESILGIMGNEIKYKARIEKDYGETPPVPCNPQRMGQVFLNLIVNALQALPDHASPAGGRQAGIEGMGTIAIKTYRQGEFVCGDVSDTGKGIEEKNLSKIFDPFFTTKTVGQGTGLGLSVSYEIVKKHGGDIKVKSKIGSGTTFTVMLPLRLNHAQREI